MVGRRLSTKRDKAHIRRRDGRDSIRWPSTYCVSNRIEGTTGGGIGQTILQEVLKNALGGGSKGGAGSILGDLLGGLLGRGRK